MLYIMGDLHARVQIKQDEIETAIGPHTFDKHNDKNLTGQSKGGIDNRQRFLAFCQVHTLKIMNTCFYKEDKYLCTYKDVGIKGPPYKRHNYETFDYFLTTNKWKNIIKDLQADPEANVDTRHHPLTAKIHIKLKVEHEQ